MCRLTNSLKKLRVKLWSKLKNMRHVQCILVSSTFRVTRPDLLWQPEMTHSWGYTYRHIYICSKVRSTVCHCQGTHFKLFPVRTLRRDEPVTRFSTSHSHQEVAQTKPRRPVPRQGQAPMHEFEGERSVVPFKAKGMRRNRTLVVRPLSSRIAIDL